MLVTLLPVVAFLAGIAVGVMTCSRKLAEAARRGIHLRLRELAPRPHVHRH